MILNENKNAMEARIKAVSDAEKARWEAKKQKSRESNIDVRDFFTEEELAEIVSEKEFKSSGIANLPVLDRFNKAKRAVQWLDANSIEVESIEIEAPDKTRPNASVALEIRRLASLRDKELRIFSTLHALADTVFISGIKEGVIRFTFGIEGLWK